ncbi:MAG: serine protease Do [Myxococcota bacterium]|jgi:serine protease Do
MSSIRILAVTLGLICGLVACSTDPVNMTQAGSIADGDDIHPADGSLYDEYTFKAKSGWDIHITMNSTEVDSFLQLRRPGVADESYMEEADDNAGGRDAELRVTAPASGTYTVWANTASATDRGAYSLTIVAEPGK